MSCCLGRNTHDMHVVLDRLSRRFLRCLEQRSDIDIEADICEGGGDHLGTTIVPILAKLYDKHPRAAPFILGKAVDFCRDLGVPLVAVERRTVDAGNRPDDSAMARELTFECIRNFTDGGAGSCSVYGELQQIGAGVIGARRQGFQRRLAGILVAGRADLLRRAT